MNSSKGNFKQALEEFESLLGRQRVITGKELESFGKNEIGAKRNIPFAVKLKNVPEVVSAVKIAKKTGVSLYPVSMGNNWGYGAKCPVEDDCIVVDLSTMDKILSFDADLGIVTVEPGVTPKILREYLDENNLSYLVPVSGAGPHRTIIGNALERGYGVTPLVDHFSAVTSLEAVLANGDIYTSALSSMGGSEVDSTFKWGIGPYIDGIFSQGNFGIVTKMTVVLAPIPKNIQAFMFVLKRRSF